MLSQPATKIFLKTSEPRAAQWISDTLGEVELERLRESRTHGEMPKPRESRSYQLEREVRPLVMKEEITGLPKGYGFFKCGNLVVRISFPYLELPERHPKFLERKTPFASIEDSDTRVTQRKAPPSSSGGTSEDLRTPRTKSQSPKDNQQQEEQQTFFK